MVRKPCGLTAAQKDNAAKYDQCAPTFCNSWCNVTGKNAKNWDCGINFYSGYACDCAGCNGCPTQKVRAPWIETSYFVWHTSAALLLLRSMRTD